jgi:hypothetical protein
MFDSDFVMEFEDDKGVVHRYQFTDVQTNWWHFLWDNVDGENLPCLHECNGNLAVGRKITKEKL